MGLPYGSDGEESDCTAGDPGSIPRPGTSLGLGNHNPLQCSCLENSMDRSLVAYWRSQLWLPCPSHLPLWSLCHHLLGIEVLPHWSRPLQGPWHPWSKRAHPQSRSSVHRAQRLCGLSRMSWPSLVPFSMALWSTLWTLWGNLLWVGGGQ